MEQVLAVVTLESDTGQPRDRVTNSYAFDVLEAATETQSEHDALMDEVRAIYSTANSTADSISSYLALSIPRAQVIHSVKLYDITGKLENRGKVMVRGKLREQGPPPHGSPFTQQMFSIPVTAPGSALPEEVAVVATTRALAWDSAPIETADGADEGTEVDRPRQRKSGRLYFGPLGTAAVALSGQTPRVHSNLRASINARLSGMQSGAEALGYQWGVWSRVNGNLWPVVRLEVDDEFDTQRRRGKRAGVRQAWNL